MDGAWPRPAAEDLRELSRLVDAIPEDAKVLWDGLIACAVPDIVHAPGKPK